MIIIMKQNMLNHITRKVILLTLFLFAATTAVVAESYTEEDLKNEVSAGEFWVFRKEVSQKLDAGDNNIPRGGCFIISIYNRYGTDKVWCYETDSEGVEPRSSTYSGVIELDVFLDALNSGKVVVIKKGRTAPTPLTEEEREYYQNMIDEINSVFIENVANGRHLSIEEATELATGLTWTGLTAVTNGVADEIGTFEDACDKAAELGGCADDYETQDLYVGSYELYDLLDLLSYTRPSDGYSAEEIAMALKELSEHDATIE